MRNPLAANCSWRSTAQAVFVAASLLLDAPAQADPTVDQCVDANTKAQSLRREGKFGAARQQLRVCVAASCPNLVRDDCAQRLDDLERAQPTIVFQVQDGQAHDVLAVRVSVDGQSLIDHLDGSAIPVDPGAHTFTFEVPGQTPVSQQFVLREGEKARSERVVVGAAVPPAPPPPPAPASAPTPVSSAVGPVVPVVVAPLAPSPSEGSSEPGHAQRVGGLIVGGAGVAGLAVGVAYTVVAASLWSNAQSECNANCPAATRPKAETDRANASTAADTATVAVVAGGVLVAAGLVLYLTAPSRPRDERSGLRIRSRLGAWHRRRDAARELLMKTGMAHVWIGSGFVLAVLSGACGTILGIGDLPPASDGGASGTTSGASGATGATGTAGTGIPTGTATTRATATMTGTATLSATATMTGTAAMTATATTTAAGTGTHTMTASGTGTGTGVDAGPSGFPSSNCVITSTGGLPLTNNYLSAAAGNAGVGGYPFSYDDMLGSVTCVESAAFCGSGTIAQWNPPSYSVYGGGIGVNLNQVIAPTSTTLEPAETTAAKGLGIAYAVTSLPAQGLRIAIDDDDGGVRYCANATTLTGMLPWSAFNTLCFNAPPDGGSLSGPPSAATQIESQVPSGEAAETFDFCVTALGFACTLTPNTCGTGSTCVAAAGSTISKCSPAGSGTMGSICAKDADCVAGFGCLVPDQGATSGLCKPWCELSPNATTCNSGSCIPLGGGLVINGITYGYCSLPCNFVTGNCGTGNTCTLAGMPGAFASDCTISGGGTQDSTCTINSDCAAGFACVTIGGDSLCEQWCELTPTATACAPGTACNAFSPSITVAGATYGFCD